MTNTSLECLLLSDQTNINETIERLDNWRQFIVIHFAVEVSLKLNGQDCEKMFTFNWVIQLLISNLLIIIYYWLLCVQWRYEYNMEP